MQQYKDLLQFVLDENAERIKNNQPRLDRTGVGRYSIFGYQTRFDLRKDAFPMVTIKKSFFQMIKSELKWFMRGETNIRPLLLEKNSIWNEWAYERYIVSDEYEGKITKADLNTKDEELRSVIEKEMKEFCERIVEDEDFASKHGDLGNIYGKQWRNIKGHDGEDIDQLGIVVEEIKDNPTSTRLLVDSWTVPDIYVNKNGANASKALALPPCHTMYQFYVEDNKLSCHVILRSNDLPVGFVFNVSSYALMTMVIAEYVGLEPGELVYTISDAHIYANQIEEVKLALSREPKPLPKIELTVNSLEDWDAKLVDYDYHPAIKIPVSV